MEQVWTLGPVGGLQRSVLALRRLSGSFEVPTNSSALQNKSLDHQQVRLLWVLGGLRAAAEANPLLQLKCGVLESEAGTGEAGWSKHPTQSRSSRRQKP